MIRFSGIRRNKILGFEWHRPVRLFFVLLSVGLVSASCGMKGDLYLPDDQPAQKFSEVNVGSEPQESAAIQK